MGGKQYRKAVAIILNDHDEVLLGVSTAEDDRRGKWACPGGHIDPEDGNDLNAAATREAYEEFGVRVRPIGTPFDDPKKPEVAFVLCQYIGGDASPNQEFSMVQWFPLSIAVDELDNIYPENKVLLQRVMAELGTSVNGALKTSMGESAGDEVLVSAFLKQYGEKGAWAINQIQKSIDKHPDTLQALADDWSEILKLAKRLLGEGKIHEALDSGKERWFFKCSQCKKPWATDIAPKSQGSVQHDAVVLEKLRPCPFCHFKPDCPVPGCKQKPYCGHAAFERVQHKPMGEVKGTRMIAQDDKPPCDARCTNAPGPSCDCKCRGENHGSHRLVPHVRDVGKAPTEATALGKPTQTPDNVNPEELLKGVKVEMEHTDDPEIALQIALDHLGEDPRYYTKLAKVHKEAVEYPGAHARSEDEFVQANLDAKRASRQAVVDQLKAQITAAYRDAEEPIKLPVGIEPWQHLLTASSPPSSLKSLRTSLTVAMKSLQADARGDELTARAVWKRMKHEAALKSKPAKAVSKDPLTTGDGAEPTTEPGDSYQRQDQPPAVPPPDPDSPEVRKAKKLDMPQPLVDPAAMKGAADTSKAVGQPPPGGDPKAKAGGQKPPAGPPGAKKSAPPAPGGQKPPAGPPKAGGKPLAPGGKPPQAGQKPAAGPPAQGQPPAPGAQPPPKAAGAKPSPPKQPGAAQAPPQEPGAGQAQQPPAQPTAAQVLPNLQAAAQGQPGQQPPVPGQPQVPGAPPVPDPTQPPIGQYQQMPGAPGQPKTPAIGSGKSVLLKFKSVDDAQRAMQWFRSLQIDCTQNAADLLFQVDDPVNMNIVARTANAFGLNLASVS